VEYAGTLDGSAPVLRKFPVGETVTDIGVPIRCGAAANGGVRMVTTTNADDLLGLSEDTATYSTTQGDPEGVVSIIVNPGARYRARLYGGATDSPMPIAVVTTAMTAGVDVVAAATNFQTPDTKDSGFIFGYTGVNAGVFRKITSVSSVTATVTVPFPNNSQIGDQFTFGPFSGIQGRADQFVGLSTDLLAVNVDLPQDADNNNFRVVEFELKTAFEEGDVSSHVILAPFYHAYSHSGRTLI